MELRCPTACRLWQSFTSTHVGYTLLLVLLCSFNLTIAQIPADNQFSLKSLRSTYCLSYNNATMNVETATCTDLPEETWSTSTNGTVVTYRDPTLCLGVTGTNVEMKTCDPLDSTQQWTPIYQSAESSIILQWVYNPTGQCLVAASAAVGGNVIVGNCVKSPDDSWTRSDRTAVNFGTIVDGSAARQWDIKSGGSTIIIELRYDTWVPTMGDDNAITTALLNNVVSLQNEATGFNALVKPQLNHTHVVRTSDRRITITLPPVNSYLITASEYIDIQVPTVALSTGKPGLQTAPRPLIFNADCLEVPGIKFSTRDWTPTACSTTGPVNWWKDEFDALPIGDPNNYCNELVTGLNTLNNAGTCGGPGTNLAYRFSLTFQPLVASDWYFRVGSDFGYGAAYYLDDVGVNYRCDDMWWATDWSSPAVFYSGAYAVTRDRSYRMDLYGLEGCCDGALVLQYKTSAAGAWTDATVANLQDDTGITSCGCWTNCSECVADPNCGWCADGNCDNSDTGPANRDPTLGQCVSGTSVGPDAGNCTRWLFGDCKNTPEVDLIKAIDSDDKDAIYSDGDIILLGFNNATNSPDLSTKTRIDNLLRFSQNIGNDYSGLWLNSSYLQITILDIGSANPQIGVMTVTVLNQVPPILTDASGCGFPTTANATTVLVGSWGDPARLNITKVANVTGGYADAQDSVHFELYLQHKATSGDFAYNITVTDILPPHVQLIPGTVTTQTDSPSFLNITAGNAPGDSSVQVFLSKLEQSQTLTVSFESLLQDSIVLGEYVTNLGYVNHSARSPEPGDEASSIPFLVNGNEGVTLTVVNSSFTESGSGEYVGGNPDLSIGEEVFVQIVNDLPEGTNNVSLAIDYPNYMQVDFGVITSVGSNLGISNPPPATVVNSGSTRQARWDFGYIGNPGDNSYDAGDRFAAVVRAVVLDDPGASTGTAGVITASLFQSKKTITSTRSIDIVEPSLQITTVANLTTMATYDPVGVTVTVSHTGSTHAAAYNVTIFSGFVSSLGLDLIPGSVTVNQGGSVLLGNAAGDSVIEANVPVLPDGSSITMTFEAYVTSALRVNCSSACFPGCCPAVITSVDLDYASAPPSGSVTPRRYSIAPGTDSIALSTPGPVITSLVANDPDDLDNYASALDTLDVFFDVDTNQAMFVTTTADINNAFVFSHGIGTSYTGSWVAKDHIRITLVTIDRNVFDPPIGGLTVTVKASAGLKIDGGGAGDPVSVAQSPVATGDWGLFASSAVIAGSLVPSSNAKDTDVIAGGQTVTISLTGTRFDNTVTTVPGVLSALMGDLTANISDPNGWNNYLRYQISPANVSLNGAGDILTINIPSRPNYVLLSGDEGITASSLGPLALWSSVPITTVTGSLTVQRTYPTVTVTPSITEADLVAGTASILVTLTGADWVSGAAFTSVRQAILDGLSSSTNNYQHAWNYSTSADPVQVSGVTRVSDSVVRIRFPAQSSYTNQGAETMTFAAPPAATTRAAPAPATQFQITDTSPQASMIGSAIPQGSSADLRAGKLEVYLVLSYEHWETGTAFDNARQAIIDGFQGSTGAEAGWNQGKANLTVSDVTRLNNTYVLVNITAMPEYTMPVRESIQVTIPSAAVLGSNPILAGNWTISVGVCGDLTRDSDESCDDGNTVSNDGCSSICELEPGYSCSLAGVCKTLACWTTEESHPKCCSLVSNDCPEFAHLSPAQY
eukprot:TRINITY_DN5703_c0_g2_i1.p1 TRINITY_DN5703_c0_g2~~TRINITY_DN5703_c0_g2_i1.p1  ORF type:complete len:1699 (-),score=265.80 TRINITY_DN5703_c0_g2_i1:27-5123(-)